MTLLQKLRTPRWLQLGGLALGIAMAAARKRNRARHNAGSGRGNLHHVWMVNHYANPPSVPGGTRHYELASLLAQHGWHSTIFASAWVHRSAAFERPVSPLQPVHPAREDGVDFLWLWSLPHQSNNWRRYANMVSFLGASAGAGLFRPRPAVVIGSSPHLFAALGAWVLARRHRVPFVLEVRDLWPESLVQLGFSNRSIITILERLERFLYQRADHIVSLTEGIVEGIAAKNVPTSRISLISNAAMRPKSRDDTQRDATRSQLGWDGSFVAIWIGAHGPANGLDVLVGAARMMANEADVRFVLVGDGAAKPDLIDAARDLNNITFLDPVPKDDVMELLRAADVGVIVHRDTKAVRGARPNKLFDYMAAGLPILLNLDGEARRLVEEASAGMYVATESAPALVDGLHQLKDSPELRHEMGRNGYARAIAGHSREDSAAELAQLLNDMATVASPSRMQMATE